MLIINKYNIKEIETSIKSFIDKHKQYSDENISENLRNSIDKITSFYQVILVHVISSLLIFISLSVAIYFRYTSFKMAGMFFLVTIPITVVITLVGIKKSVSNLVTGINEISNYILEFLNLYYKELQINPEKAISPSSYVIQIVFSNFILPVIKDIISGNLIGKFVILCISKSVQNLSVETESNNETVIVQETEQTPTSQENYNKVQTTLLKINKIKSTIDEKSDKYLRRFRLLINIILTLSIVLGIPVMLLIIFILKLIGIVADF